MQGLPEGAFVALQQRCTEKASFLTRMLQKFAAHTSAFVRPKQEGGGIEMRHLCSKDLQGFVKSVASIYPALPLQHAPDKFEALLARTLGGALP